MKLSSKSFPQDGRIPSEFAFAALDTGTHVSLSSNRNPHLAWDDVPAGTKSFVLICHDPDVPSRPDDVNKEAREIPASFPRIDFYHWILMDIPPTVREIGAGAHSDSVTPRGKSGPSAGGGLRHGVNDYTNWFAEDPEMRGEYYGYDGPAPPWNDSIVHHYVFTLYALDVPHLEVQGDLSGPHAVKALGRACPRKSRSYGHVLVECALGFDAVKSLGTRAAGARLERMKASALWAGDRFQNMHPVLPNLRDPAVPMPSLKEFMCGGERRVPRARCPR